jgi:hypothetical protein
MVEIHAANPRRFSFVWRGIKVGGLFQRRKEEWTKVGSQNEENPDFRPDERNDERATHHPNLSGLKPGRPRLFSEIFQWF